MINDANLYVHVDNEPPSMRLDYPEVTNGDCKDLYSVSHGYGSFG
jgi:hypothetical protein